MIQLDKDIDLKMIMDNEQKYKMEREAYIDKLKRSKQVNRDIWDEQMAIR
jgi:hypothetical protein